MKRLHLSIIIICFTFFTFKDTYGQSDSLKTSRLTIAAYHNMVGLPGTLKFALFSLPIHPGIYAGTEFHYKGNEKGFWYQSAGLSYYEIHLLHKGIVLNTSFGYRKFTRSGIFGEIALNAAYLHTFNDGGIYTFDPQKGYTKQMDWGRPHIAPGIEIGAGYRFKNGNMKNNSLFLLYQFQPEYPFTLAGKIPLLPHTNLFLGTRINIR